MVFVSHGSAMSELRRKIRQIIENLFSAESMLSAIRRFLTRGIPCRLATDRLALEAARFKSRRLSLFLTVLLLILVAWATLLVVLPLLIVAWAALLAAVTAP